MVNSDIPASFIAIAPPDRSEWQPTSAAVNPKVSFPMDVTAALIFVRIWKEVISFTFPFIRTVLIFLSQILSSPGWLLTLVMIFAQIDTGS